ncbi:hypothetical protein [Maribellus sediminis]|uniref:hypothetical protein n=1 Tax=Maribellus sediminis TaxID=2696285 RepID=UPI00142FDB31|nr:hypothetical protein [Maribellus sediminis]
MKTLPFIAILVSMFLTPVSLAQKLNQVVLDAYHLRMNNEATEAADLLENYLKKDSTDALVYFEYARTLCHLSPEQIEFNRAERKRINNTDTLKRMQALGAIDRAIKLDPWNHYYSSLRTDIIFSLGSNFQSKVKLDQIDNTFNVLEKDFEVRPSIEIAHGLYVKYYMQSLMDSTKADPVKIKKYRDYLEENDRFLFLKIKYEEVGSGKKMSRLDYYLQFLTTDSLNFKLLKQLGDIYLEKDSVTRAIGFYEDALEISGDYQDVLGFLWLNPIAESKSLRHNLNVESKETLDEWKVEKIMAFLETNPNAPSKCLSYMSLSNIYRRWGENEKAQEMELMARKTEPYFYKLGHYDETLLRNPLEVFEYCNLRENLSE